MSTKGRRQAAFCFLPSGKSSRHHSLATVHHSSDRCSRPLGTAVRSLGSPTANQTHVATSSSSFSLGACGRPCLFGSHGQLFLSTMPAARSNPPRRRQEILPTPACGPLETHSMHAAELVDLAASSPRTQVLVNAAHSLPTLELERYWAASRCRIDRWGLALAAVKDTRGSRRCSCRLVEPLAPDR